ncbi:PGF-CTERM sorting domain-containing protein [Haloarcula nitratireducens]|uniref:PGF-CTERM sorting domain-containing protein n=1 Tax=Haloarcula nitratireducens TaxID=2487749 RepID=A0AAW4PI18_9EURY|nr:PGF-CTERM sorting domain-containing protein [Halomicroarcula nitratireducens]MBX0297752.1 PGF-CTERM sorting domain-containing protein [Halomicroarcula nitratireducens]
MTNSKRLLTVLLTGVVLLSGAVSGVALADDQVQSNPSQIPDSQVFEISDSGQMMGWERAAFTLRTDDTDAATQIPAPGAVYGEELDDESFSDTENDGGNTKSMVRYFADDRNPIGIHQSGEPVDIAFDADRASSGNYDALYNQDRVQLVAARMKTNEGDGVPVTSDGAIELLSDVDSANENASFTMLEESASLNGEGQLNTTSSFGPGQYVVFAVVHEDGESGINVDSSELSVDGDVVLIGMDQLTVQKGPMTVDKPSNKNPGDSLTFEVNASETFDSNNDGGMTHVVAVYEKETFEESRFDSVVDTDKLGNDFSQSENLEVEHSISHVNGVANVEDGTTLNQNALSEGEVARQVEFGSIIDFIANDLNGETVRTDNITAGGEDNNDYEELDASLTVVNGENPTTDVTVDTFKNFSKGKYQYVVISMQDDNDSQLSSTTGTIKLEPERKGGGGGPPRGGGGDGNEGEDPETPETPDTPANPDTPGEPDTPDVPDNDDDTPDTPDTPATPDAPDEPGDGGDGSDGGDGGDGDAGDETPTSGDGPGFTALVAVVAIIAAALLAVRREN